jgi:hypothetical protein
MVPIELSTPAVESYLSLSSGSDPTQHSSRFMAVLEAAWSELRRIDPDVPQVVLLALSAREYSCRGHFTMEAWRKRHEQSLLHEVAVHPGMFESPADLLITILHEAAHAVLWERRKDGDQHCCGVSLTGYYHRKEFRSAARRLGLQVHFRNRRYGFCVTTWPVGGVPEKYTTVLETLRRFTVVASRRLPPHVAPPPAKKQVPWLLVECACQPARTVRVPGGELQRGGIVCGVCGGRFTRV